MRPALATIALVLAAACTQGEGGASTVVRDGDELFGERVIPRFELELDAAARAALRAQPKEWVRGTFRYAGETYADVAVRLKGNRSRQGLDGKPSFKIRFDKHVPRRRFRGRRELVLNNLVEDPTMVREALAYRLHRELGVAAPRTGWAQLRVDGEDFGLYLNVEAVNKQLLERSFGDGRGDGTLYEGEFGCDLFPDDAARFEQDGGDDEQHADLIELARLTHADPARLLAADGPLDLERVVAFLAVSNVVGDFDGYRHAHNYRLYHAPEGGRWSFLPWGLDRTFKRHLAATDSGGLVARRCFADRTCRAAYARALERAATSLERMIAGGILDRWFVIVDAAGRDDHRRPHDARTRSEARAALRRFVAERPGEVRASLVCLAPDAPASCPAAAAPSCDAVAVGGVGFHLCRTPLTWSDAEAVCRGLGAHLARLDDEAQTQAVAALALTRSAERWWIGLSDRAREGTAAWADGAPVTFTHWSRGQPDDAACGEDCAALKPRRGGAWSDGHCEQRRPFVCR